MIIGFIIYGISAIFGYLNTGADRSSMLHTEIQKIEQYTPKISWSKLPNEGRPIDDENRKAIENDYLDAWYVMHLSNKTHSTAGIEDYFTDSARQNLYDIIELNATKNIVIESTTLEHHPKLEFFSEDGQLAVITDHDVIEYKRLFKQDEFLQEFKEQSTYKVILLLEDGFWRIRHFTKIQSKPFKPAENQVELVHKNIKGINYYPKDTPWDMFGESFSEDILRSDFNLLKDAGLNTIRVFIQYDDFGNAKVNNKKLDKLKTTLDLASEADLKVMITLFDFYGNYEVLDWTLNMKHAETLVNAVKNHEALWGWDIKNEPNLDFESRGQSNVLSWLENMINHVKYLDPNHPVTIGWSNIESASLLSDNVDVITFHFYEDLSTLEDQLKTLVSQTEDKPLLLGEFGMSSYNGFWKPFGTSDEDQAEYHKTAQQLISKLNLNAMSWTLYDFDQIPKEVVGRLPWRKHLQKHFGFLDKEGQPKAAFQYISSELD
ncbi:cellulase family glycosylhydrolase [Psychroserpens sp. XS_ASV72]|uniref:DUF4434 domain-containing protein n=1 Tax=Psychroserpens sp. XS_ASV72 TaxID=3241293 RepID=UPI003514B499